MHIFISYRRDDQRYARQLADWLIGQGFQVWIDDKVEPSDNWWQSIVRAIQDCAAMIVIMTPEADATRWVRREVALAEKWNKPLFLLLLEGENWPLFVLTQYVDVRSRRLPPPSFCDELAIYARRGKNEGVNIAQPVAVAAQVPAALSFVLPPPFEWIDIPAGVVTLEDTGKHRGTKAGTYEVAAFKIAKYHITNAQYDVFVTDPQGYADPVWWDFSSDAKDWRDYNPESPDTAFPGPDLPRTNVSWYDAVAFCRWLAARLNGLDSPLPQGEGPEVRAMLPTEQQWQRAAQGDDGREYPWGSQPPDETLCNFDRNVCRPTPVTRYPAGASPFGVMDMSGNVWEWCLTEWITGTANLAGRAARVLRGGSWFNDLHFIRCAYRHVDLPNLGFDLIGFRVVCAVPM